MSKSLTTASRLAMLCTLRNNLLDMQKLTLAIARGAAASAMAQPPQDCGGEDPVLAFLSAVQAVQRQIKLDLSLAAQAEAMAAFPPIDRSCLH